MRERLGEPREYTNAYPFCIMNLIDFRLLPGADT